MAEWARLLSECRGNLVAGSNPALPATRTRLIRRACFCLIWSHVLTGRMIFESRPPRHKKHVPQGACFLFYTGRVSRKGMIFEFRPPRHKNTPELLGVFLFNLVARPLREDDIRIPPSPPQKTRFARSVFFYFEHL